MTASPSLNNSPKEIVKGTMVLFIAIVTGLFIFMLLSVVINKVQGAFLPRLMAEYKILAIVLALFSFVCRLIAKHRFAKGISAIKDSSEDLSARLNKYRITLVIYLLICEFPVLASIIIYLLTGNFVFLAYAAILFGFMLVMIPTKKKFAEQLELDVNDQEHLGL